MRLKTLLISLLLAPAIVAGADSAGPPLSRFEYARLKMGTTFRIVLYASNQAEARQAADQAFSRIDDLEAILSHYRPDSEISRLSASSGQGERPVGVDLYRVLSASVRLARLTDGAFDFTVGPVVLLWRESRRTHKMPDDGALDRARKLVGYRNVEIRTDKHSVNLKKKGMQLDLSGVAKGYSAEQALLVLRSRGITRALVDAGGDIVVSDPPPGREGWRVAVEKPGPDTGPVRPILLINSAIATSGGTYQYSEIQGKRYSHIVNPKTGVGSTVPASATVIAPDGMTADALATALCVMPPEEGLKLVESLPGVSALITIETPDGLERYRSSGFPP